MKSINQTLEILHSPLKRDLDSIFYDINVNLNNKIKN